MAMVALREGLTDEANSFIQSSLILGTKDPSIYLTAAHIYRALGDVEQSQYYYQKVIDQTFHQSLLYRSQALEGLQALTII